MQHIITEKQRNLLLLSETTKQEQFKELYAYLAIHKRVSLKEAQRVPALSNLTAYVDELIRECQSEWEHDETQPMRDLGAKYERFSRKCELCGNRPIRYENTIINRLNRKRLVIGSECLKEYGEDLVRNLENRKRAARRLYIESQLKGMRSFVEDGWKYPRKLDMIIPSSFTEEWEYLFKQIGTQYESYLNGKTGNEKRLKRLWEYKRNLEQRIDKYIIQNRDNRFASTKEIHMILLQNKNQKVIKSIQEDDGFIKWRNIHRIHEPNFMRKTLRDLNLRMAMYNTELKGITDNNRVVLTFLGKLNRKIEAIISYSALLLEMGGLLYIESENDDSYDINHIIKESTLSRKSHEKLLVFPESKVRNLKWIDEYDSDEEAVYRLRGSYHIVKARNLTNELKIHYLFDSKISYEDILLNHTSEKLTYDEFKDFLETRIEIKKMADR